LQVQRRPATVIDEERVEAGEILRGESLFGCLSDTQIDTLVRQSRFNHFGRGERVIEEGAEGDSMFVRLRGAAKVSVSKIAASSR
jgi:hypothetical protein